MRFAPTLALIFGFIIEMMGKNAWGWSEGCHSLASQTQLCTAYAFEQGQIQAKLEAGLEDRERFLWITDKLAQCNFSMISFVRTPAKLLQCENLFSESRAAGQSLQAIKIEIARLEAEGKGSFFYVDPVEGGEYRVDAEDLEQMGTDGEADQLKIMTPKKEGVNFKVFVIRKEKLEKIYEFEGTKGREILLSGSVGKYDRYHYGGFIYLKNKVLFNGGTLVVGGEFLQGWHNQDLFLYKFKLGDSAVLTPVIHTTIRITQSLETRNYGADLAPVALGFAFLYQRDHGNHPLRQLEFGLSGGPMWSFDDALAVSAATRLGPGVFVSVRRSF